MLDSTFFETKLDTITLDSFRGENKPFLIACFGGGRDSAAGMVLFSQLGIRPDLVLMSDTKAEREATYNYLPIMNGYLRSVGFPEITMVNAGRTRDSGIEAHLFRLGVFASLSYGRHSCSVQWKIEGQNRYIANNAAVREARRQGRPICRAVFFEAGEEYRAKRADANAIGETVDATGCKRTTAFAVSPDDDGYVIYPLIEAGIDFDGVLDLIVREGLPIPKKSSCTICAAMTELEIYELSQQEPHKFFRALVLERVVQRNQIVKAGRVQGIAFGVSWTKYECSAPYIDRLDEVIDLFGLDRAVEDGNPNSKSETWRPKAARVELFLECFSTAENLRRFMDDELDTAFYAEKVQAINLMPTGAQMSLPL